MNNLCNLLTSLFFDYSQDYNKTNVQGGSQSTQSLPQD